MAKRKTKQTAIWFAIWFVLPLSFYLISFCVYTYPWITHFSSGFFSDGGDGFQNIWNMWWVNKSLTELHQSPWHTQYLHWPHGVSLLGQSMNPFNGFVAIALLPFLSLAQAYNVMVTFSFVVGGLTAFWLCYQFTKVYLPSLIGGFVFTFSSYHFAHAIGHMQLVSLEWIPLFLLLWWRLLIKPSYLIAAGAALALLLVILCDYYYFFYSLISAGIILLYLWRTKPVPPFQSQTLRPLTVFAALCALFVSPLPLALVQLNASDPLSGSHPARILSTDAFAPFIYGGFWRFSSLTQWYWSKLPAYFAESSVHLGFSVIVVLAISWFGRKKFGLSIGLWQIIIIVFGVLSLGPRLNVFGETIEAIPLPYALAEKLFPPLALSGVPVRMMVMVVLGSALVVAIVLSSLSLNMVKDRVALGAFSLIMIVEVWPGRLPLTNPIYPPYVDVLRELATPSGIVDYAATSAPHALYYQTIHEKPMILGYISRTPKSVEDKDWQIVASILEGKYYRLCSEFRIRYFATPPDRPLAATYPVIYQGNDALIYDLKDSPAC